MPTILVINGFRFYFFSNENNEPPNVHIEKAGANGKIILDTFEIEYFYGFSKNEQKKIIGIVKENVEILKNAWYDYFK